MKQLKESLDEGWVVHVYGGNRRLLCALEPSHGWAFFTGLMMGLLVAIVGYNLSPSDHSWDRPSPSQSPIEAPLRLD